jgi:hypothetical protein
VKSIKKAFEIIGHHDVWYKVAWMVGKMRMQDTSKAPMQYGTLLGRLRVSNLPKEKKMTNGHFDVDDDVNCFVLVPSYLDSLYSKATKKTD